MSPLLHQDRAVAVDLQGQPATNRGAHVKPRPEATLHATQRPATDRTTVVTTRTCSSAYVWVEPEDGLGPQLVQRPHLFCVGMCAFFGVNVHGEKRAGTRCTPCPWSARGQRTVSTRSAHGRHAFSMGPARGQHTYHALWVGEGPRCVLQLVAGLVIVLDDDVSEGNPVRAVVTHHALHVPSKARRSHGQVTH
jgi:hypothetical protein